MVTSSCVIGLAHGPLLNLHRKTFGPIDKPDTVVFDRVELANVPVPDTTVHKPVAGKIGVLPARVALLPGAQTDWSGPALAAGEAGENTTMLTSSIKLPQGPLLMVYRNVLMPMANPETVVVVWFALAKVPEPATTVHVPVAGDCGGVRAVKVKLVNDP